MKRLKLLKSKQKPKPAFKRDRQRAIAKGLWVDQEKADGTVRRLYMY